MLFRKNRRDKSALKRQHAITSSQRDGNNNLNGLNISFPTKIYIELSLPPPSNTFKEDLFIITFSENIPSPECRLFLLNFKTPVLFLIPLSTKKISLTLCQKCTCNKCVKSKKYKKGTDGNSDMLDTGI